MSRLKLTQKGFSAIEVLLFLILLSIIGFTGYYVYHANQKTNDTYSASTDSANGASKKSTAKNKATEESKLAVADAAGLQTYLIKTCSSADGAAINAMFANDNPTVDSDNYKISGNYAIANVSCTLDSGTQLSTEFLKFSSNAWDLSVKGGTEVSCSFLTGQGYPDDLKAPYCSNGQMLN